MWDLYFGNSNTSADVVMNDLQIGLQFGTNWFAMAKNRAELIVPTLIFHM